MSYAGLYQVGRNTCLAVFVVLAVTYSNSGCGLFEPDLCCTSVPTICVQPSSELGGPCAHQWDCPTGSTCFDGTCREPVFTGQPCAQMSDCADGLLCACEPPYCGEADSVCHPPGATELFDQCWSDDSCESGICNWAMDYTCRLAAPAGEVCLSDSDCESGLTCNWGLNPHLCQAPGGEGAPCIYQRDCREGHVCEWNDDVEKRCVARDVSIGDACTFDECGTELVCDQVERVCAQRAALGELCVGIACVDGATCNHGLEPAICVEPGSSGQGEGCYQDIDCAAGLMCGNGLCRLPGFRAAGDMCDDDEECGGGLRCGYAAD